MDQIFKIWNIGGIEVVNLMPTDNCSTNGGTCFILWKKIQLEQNIKLWTYYITLTLR
jgi:hypothetical protein